MPGTERLTADEVASTDAGHEALTRLREVTGDVDGPMERHGLRCHLLCVRMAEDAGIEVDEEVLFVAGLVHDIGLYDGASENGVYVTDGRHYAERMVDGRDDWSPERVRLLGDAIERHHEIRPQWDAGAEVEFLRRADAIELSRGVIAYGVSRGWIRGLWRTVPPDGLYREVAKMVLKAVRERPATIPRILIRGR